jgi:hypothetical protein
VPSHRPDLRRDAEGGWIAWATATVVAVVLSAAFVAAAFWATETGGPRTYRVQLPAELGRCGTDADCVVVDRIGCCACQTGGAQWAVNANEQDALRRFIKRTCRRQRACIQIETCRRDLAARCDDGACALEIVPVPVGEEPANG